MSEVEAAPLRKRKFLVVIDNTVECDRAVLYAARRAKHTQGGIVMLYGIVPDQFQHWLGVEEVMRAEAFADAEAAIETFKVFLHERDCTIEPEVYIKEGPMSESISDLIAEDKNIATLVLAASTNKEGPGPLVSSITSRAGTQFPISVTIVPGHLSDTDIQAIS